MTIEEMDYEQVQEMIDIDSRAYTKACECVERLKRSGGEALARAERVRDALSKKMQRLLDHDFYLRNRRIMRGEVLCHQQLG